MEIVNKYLTVKKFKKYTNEKEFSRKIDKIVLHHTSDSLESWKTKKTSIGYYKKMYEKRGWTTGPHLFIDEGGIFLFTDINIEGTHANSANKGSIGIEMVGNYDKKVPKGKIWEKTKRVLNILLKKFDLNVKDIHLHRKFNPNKSCPGKAITLKWIYSELKGVFSATYPDFIRFDKNPTKPNEDAFLFSKKYPIFLVADGVTQSHFKNGKYAYPDGAKKAANIFCSQSLKVLEKKYQSKNIKESLELAFSSSNQKIKKLNIKYGIDKKMNYVEHDWFDTVGIAGMIKDKTLYYNYVGDCGLIIFNKNNKKIFQTKDMVRPAVIKFQKRYNNYKELSSDERALIMHRDFRNREDGEGYGSLSGEENVEKYYSFGSKKLNKGDLVVFYSDGFLEHFKNEEFVKILRKRDKKMLDKLIFKLAKENHKNYGSDRTLISLNI
ncbi:MAG: N-acetylmuramoyl-L-alanine amidase, partial [Bacilli bacterium]|nr:N-acetylmuramoyl-L-alanine amidase [Bacilli bacterium]